MYFIRLLKYFNSLFLITVLQFSSVLIPNENGKIYGDAGADRISTLHLDKKITFDENTVSILFDQDEDYQLQYIIDHMTVNDLE